MNGHRYERLCGPDRRGQMGRNRASIPRPEMWTLDTTGELPEHYLSFRPGRSVGSFNPHPVGPVGFPRSAGGSHTPRLISAVSVYY